MSDGERRLLALPRFATDVGAYRPGLDRIRALLAALGDPQKAFPAIHVAGTNGKGSTASLAASVAQAAGLRVGLHTSPHLLTLRERMRVDGEPAPAAWLDAAVGRLADVLAEVGPSFFEATVALSLAYFAERSVDLAVVEVGLGGRLDGTNVVEPVVSVVTHIGLDHTDLLGETVDQIAVEKAGIARPGVPFLHAVEAGREALEAEARRRGAPVENVRQSCAVGAGLRTPARDYGPVRVGLAGPHQAWNAALAVRAVEVAFERWTAPPASRPVTGSQADTLSSSRVRGTVGSPAERSDGRSDRGSGVRGLSPQAARAGLAEVAQRTGLRGRAERWRPDPRVTLDVAHNADGWRAALAALAPGGQLWAVVGVMADKDAGALADALAEHAARAVAVDLGTGRALAPDALADRLRQRGVPAETGDVLAALAAFRAEAGARDRLLVTGSHQTVAAFLARTRDALPG